MAENVSDINKYVTVERHDRDVAQLDERRDGGERRLERRVGLLELAEQRMRKTVIGENGDNGLSSNVKILDLRVSQHSKVLWWVTTVLGSTIVGLASTFLLRLAL